MQTFWKKTANLSLLFSIVLVMFCASPVLARPNETARSQRRFSYRPVSFHVGDHVQVSTADTKVMKGADTVGTLKHGESFQITKIMGSWLGISTDHNGQKMNGWVYEGDVMAPGSAASPPAAPQVERRAYSYQPTQQYFSGGGYYYNYSPAKQPWQYPKTDPRRYRIHP